MAGHRRRKAVVGMEALERRDTPSHLGVASALHQQRVVSRVVALRGSGQTTDTQISTLPGGGFQETSLLFGSASPIGNYSGQLSGTLTRATHLSGTARLIGASGELDLAINGSFRAPRANATVVTGTLPFKVIGGTGAFANATGSGTIRGTVNLTTGGVGFTLNGKIRE